METGLREKLERWKILAENYLKEDKRVLIKDLNDNWYFADIILVGDTTITVKCYAPEQRAGEKYVIAWPLVTYFELAKEERA